LIHLYIFVEEKILLSIRWYEGGGGKGMVGGGRERGNISYADLGREGFGKN
jgi:hypothetical protein